MMQIERVEDGAVRIQLDIRAGYECLFHALMAAYEQAAEGKGSERHALGREANFEDQPIFWIAEEFGDGFLDGQAVKKIHEARSLPPARAIEEYKGAIVYLAVRILRLSGEAMEEQE